MDKIRQFLTGKINGVLFWIRINCYENVNISIELYEHRVTEVGQDMVCRCLTGLAVMRVPFLRIVPSFEAITRECPGEHKLFAILFTAITVDDLF